MKGPLLLGDGWYADRPGGLNRYLAELLAALRRAGSPASAVVLGPAAGAPPEVAVAGLRHQSLPLRLWRFRRGAVRAGVGADVVDAHFALNAAGPVVLGPLAHLPLVVHFQGPWADERTVGTSTTGAATAARRGLERAVYRRADRVVVLSSAFRRVLIERYRVAPWVVEVVAPGVDLERFRPGDRGEARVGLGLEPAGQVVLAVRRLVPRMGLDVLLRAWPAVADRAHGARLVVVGAGPERRHLEELARRLGVEGSVSFMGTVDDAALARCYRAADVSVVPSTAWEGFGLVVLESLASGTPAVVTDAGGLPEAVDGLDAGLVVPAGDPGALAARLASGLDGSDPLPDGEACRAHARRFGWEVVAHRHLDLYDSARHAGGDRGRRPGLGGPGSRRLRVVYLDHCARLSGAELALLRLLPALADAVEAHVILAEEGPLATRLVRSGLSVEVMAMAETARGLRRSQIAPGPAAVAGAARSLGHVLRLAGRLRRLRPDLVHTNSLKAALYGGLAARLAGIPVVWHVRDRVCGDSLPPAAVRLVRAAADRLPAAVIANSQATMATLAGAGGAIRAVVPSPVGPEFRPVEGREGAGGDGAALSFGMVGRLAPWKGQHVFLDAFARAFPGPGHRAVIVGGPLFGEEDYEDSLRQQAQRLGLAGRVDLRGFRDDVAGELAGLDVAVHASVAPEPFGQVVVEAMAVGLPVVAAGEGGPAEIIDHGVDGLLSPPGDVAALAGALARLAGDAGLRRRLGSAAAVRARDFRPEAVGSRVVDVYRRVVGAGR